MKMSGPSCNRFQENQAGQGIPSGEAFPLLPEYPPEYGYPLQDTEQQIGILPTSTVINRNLQAQPDDYLALSIFVLVCCCFPLGIVAVVKANEVNSRFRLGDYDGAVESSRQAKSWAMSGLFSGIALWSINAVCCIVYINIVAVAEREAVEEGSYQNS